MSDKSLPREVVVVDADLEELIPDFLEHRQRELQEIAEALARHKYDKLRMIGHNLKGIGGGYGFAAISQIGAQMEVAAEKEQGDQLASLAEALRSYLANIEIVYE